MRRIFAAIAMTCLVYLPSSVLGDEGAGNWPSFRGPQASGIAEGHPLPATWDVDKGENVRWRTKIPGLGHSCPVIWGDRIYVTTAVGKDDQPLRIGLYGDIAPVPDEGEFEWKVLCLDKKTGRILWEQTAYKGKPEVKRHTKATHANSTPATDGRHVVAFFGSEGLYCYDSNGKQLWSKDFGTLDAGFHAVPDAQWGFGSSPVIHADRVIVQCDVQKDSFIAALDLKDGREIWRTPRNEAPTWSTPTLHFQAAAGGAGATGVSGGANGHAAGPVQIVVNGWRHIGGYDFSDGKEIWKMAGTGGIPVPTPVVAHDLFFITANHRPKPFVAAVKAGARGELTLPSDDKKHEFVAWADNKGGAYMQTPIVYGDVLYVCRDNGVLTAYDARTGAELFKERLGTGSSGFTASPVGGDGKLYYTSEQGHVSVVKAGRTFELMGSNAIGQVCMATPAISEGALYFRTDTEVVAIGPKE